MHEAFEAWFKRKDFYLTLIFIHGKSLFFKDQGMYRLLVVRIAYEAWLEDPQCKQAV